MSGWADCAMCLDRGDVATVIMDNGCEASHCGLQMTAVSVEISVCPGSSCSKSTFAYLLFGVHEDKFDIESRGNKEPAYNSKEMVKPTW